MLYLEFAQYKELNSPYGCFVKAYSNSKGKTFYVEPGFHMALMVYQEKMPDEYPSLIKRIHELIEEVGTLYFSNNVDLVEEPLEGYRYLEVEDIANRLGIYLSDDNRPSDYGD